MGYAGGKVYPDNSRETSRRLHWLYDDRLIGRRLIPCREPHGAVGDLESGVAGKVHRHPTRRTGDWNGRRHNDARRRIGFIDAYDAVNHLLLQPSSTINDDNDACARKLAALMLNEAKTSKPRPRSRPEP